MSRLIKDYGFHKEFADSIAITAEEIEEVELPLAVVPEHGTYAVKAKAFETSQGVHLYLCPINNDKLNDELTTIVVNEEQFCDALYDIAIQGKTPDDSTAIRNMIAQLVLVAFPELKNVD